MKFFLLSTLTFFILILCTASLPQTPDFGISPTIIVSLGSVNNDEEPAMPVFPLNSELKIKWTSKGIEDDPIVLIQVFYIFPSIPKVTYVPLLRNKEVKKANLKDGSFALKLDPGLFEAEKKFLITVTLNNDQEVVGTSKIFGICDKCQ